MKEIIIEELGLRPSGERGWYNGDCPYCKRNKLGLLFIEGGLFFHCLRATCAERGSFRKLANKLGLTDFTEESTLQAAPVKKLAYEPLMPLFFKRIFSHPYLDKRGFSFYKRYEVGTSFELPGYVVFLIKIGQDFRGWIARDAMGGKLRYKNSKHTKFGELLFGISEVRRGDTVYLVEGIFDKFNFDKHRNTHKTKGISSVATFGARLTSGQLTLLLEKNPKEVIVAYDNDAQEKAKGIVHKLYSYFDKVGLCIPCPELDLGEITSAGLESLLNRKQGVGALLQQLPRKKW